MGQKLLFSIVNQELIREDNVFLVNKGQKFVEAEFTFKTEDWNNIDKYVIFSSKGKNYTIPLGNYKECTTVIPKEVLQHTNFRVSIFGGDMITTNSVKILLEESGYRCNITPTGKQEPDDIFKTILNKLSRKYDDIEFRNNKMICYADGEIVSIISMEDILAESIGDNYYSKEEIDNKLSDLLLNNETLPVRITYENGDSEIKNIVIINNEGNNNESNDDSNS